MKEDRKNSENGKVELIFEFARYILQVDHKYIEDVGEFTSFCLRTFYQGYSIDELSKITLLPVDLIDEQLKFLRERGYLTEENILTDRGRLLVKIFEFREKYGNSLAFYVEPYLEQSQEKLIFLPDEIEPFIVEDGNSIKSRIGKTWLTRIVNDFERDKFAELLLRLIPKEREFIEDQKEKFIFSAAEERRVKVKLEFTVHEIFSLLDFHQANELKIGIPILILEEPKIEMTIENEKIKEPIANWKKENRELLLRRVFNLLDGTPIETIYQQESSDFSLFRLKKLIDIDQLELPKQSLQIPLRLLPFVSIKNEIVETFAVAFLKRETLNLIFQKKIKKTGAV